MPKATTTNTTTAPPVISGQAAISIADTIGRLKEIADVSQDHLYLSDGPVNPDHTLLDLCAEGLHLAKEYRRISETRLADLYRSQAEKLYDNKVLFESEQKTERQLRSAYLKASKLPARTPAGLFAKASLCRASKTGAAVLAMSLADDFLACDEIRLAIWKPEAVV